MGEHGEFPEISDPAEIDAFVHDWVECFNRREPYVGEEMFADGRWVLISHRPTSDAASSASARHHRAEDSRNRPAGREDPVGGLTDSLIAATHDLEKAREKAEEANRSKSNFCADDP